MTIYSPTFAINKFIVAILCFVLLAPASFGQEAVEPTYTLTLPDKKLFAVPPGAGAALPKSLVVKVELQVQKLGDNNSSLRVVSSRGTAAFLDNMILLDMQNIVLQGSARLGVSGQTATGAPAYDVTINVQNVGVGTYGISLPRKDGVSLAGAKVLHPLPMQLLLGKLYNFKKGGAQTFALLPDWDGDALNPANKLSTLTLEAGGIETVTLKEGKFPARKLQYKLSGSAAPNKERAGTFYIGKQGEVLQCAPALFGIPFDGGKAVAPAVVENGVLTLRTTNGETIKGTQNGDGFVVELYGKPNYPFVVASLKSDLSIERISERWNGREKSSIIANGNVNYSFGGVYLESVSAEANNAWFFPFWFATEFWEGNQSMFVDGQSYKGTYIPLVLSGERGVPLVGKRERDVNARVSGQAVVLRRYRFTADKSVNYDVYTDGRRLILLTGSNDIKITQNGYETFAATVLKPNAPELKSPVSQK